MPVSGAQGATAPSAWANWRRFSSYRGLGDPGGARWYRRGMSVCTFRAGDSIDLLRPPSVLPSPGKDVPPMRLTLRCAVRSVRSLSALTGLPWIGPDPVIPPSTQRGGMCLSRNGRLDPFKSNRPSRAALATACPPSGSTCLPMAATVTNDALCGIRKRNVIRLPGHAPANKDGADLGSAHWSWDVGHVGAGSVGLSLSESSEWSPAQGHGLCVPPRPFPSCAGPSAWLRTRLKRCTVPIESTPRTTATTRSYTKRAALVRGGP